MNTWLWVFSFMHGYLWERGDFLKWMIECPIQQAVGKEEVVSKILDTCPINIVCKISQQIHVPWMRSGELPITIIISFHQQVTEVLQGEIYPTHMKFCDWIIQNDQLIPCLFLTSETVFVRYGIRDHRKIPIHWPWRIQMKQKGLTFQYRFSVNMWCEITDDRHNGPFMFEYCFNAVKYLTCMKTTWQNCWQICHLRSDKICCFSMIMHEHTFRDRCVRQFLN